MLRLYSNATPFHPSPYEADFVLSHLFQPVKLICSHTIQTWTKSPSPTALGGHHPSRHARREHTQRSALREHTSAHQFLTQCRVARSERKQACTQHYTGGDRAQRDEGVLLQLVHLVARGWEVGGRVGVGVRGLDGVNGAHRDWRAGG